MNMLYFNLLRVFQLTLKPLPSNPLLTLRMDPTTHNILDDIIILGVRFRT